MISGYINSVPFSVYNCGEFVVEDISYYYVRWSPNDLSDGTFRLDGRTYYFSSYSGYFSGFNGTIPSFAFSGAKITSLETNAVSVLDDAFLQCKSLLYANLYNCTTLGDQAFGECFSLQTALLPRCRYIDDINAFAHCYSLTTVSLPRCSYIGSYGFAGCSNLKSITLPALEVVSAYTFAGCYKLSYVDLYVCSYIYSYAFDYLNSSITSINYYLRSTSMCRIQGSDAFHARYSEKSKFYFYVPSSLVTTYQNNASWAYYSSRIFPISQ